MQKYESKICSIPAPAGQVYPVLSNLMNLEKVRELIPQDKVSEMEITPDYIRMKVDGLAQKITIRIADREENKTVKFALDDMPMEAYFWIQLKEVAPMDTRVRLTLHAEIPLMFRMMLDKKIQQGLDDGAQMLTQFPYSNWQ